MRARSGVQISRYGSLFALPPINLGELKALAEKHFRLDGGQLDAPLRVEKRAPRAWRG
jgi:hypothetical protein